MTSKAEDTIKSLEQSFDKNDFASFKKEYTQFLNQFPEFQKSLSSDREQSLQVVNPMFGGEKFLLKKTTAAQAEEIMEKGRAAKAVFGNLPLEQRLDFLEILRKRITAHQEDIKLTITADMGKPIELTAGEITKGNAWFDYAQKQAPEQLKEKKSSIGKVETIVSTKPAGVVQVIGAFNYPYALTIPGVVGGLATGNSVVVSTPDKAPNWVFPFMEAAKEAVKEFTDSDKNKFTDEQKSVLKDGLIQYSIGRGSGLSKMADVVHFVGGDGAGEALKAERGRKPTILELGGSNVVTVMDSAVTDDEKAKKIATEIWGGFGPATGQRCTAPRILCVQDGAAVQVSEKLRVICDEGPAVGEGGVGNPFKKGTKIGPLVDAGAYNKMEEAINFAEKLGANVHGKLNVSGNTIPHAGKWVNPIVIDWSSVEARGADDTKKVYDFIKKEEIFAPLTHIIHPVKDLDEAIKKTHELDTHNLAGAIYTNNENDVARYFSETKATSKTHNGAPKDLSPDGLHGHPNELYIGGDKHFINYGVEVGKSASQSQQTPIGR